MTNKLRRFVRVGNARVVTGMQFQEDPSNRSRYTAVVRALVHKHFTNLVEIVMPINVFII